MNRYAWLGLVTISVLTLAPGRARAAEPAWVQTLPERNTLSDDWFGFGRSLAERGLVVSLATTNVYQVNLDGGLATHRRSGRYAGSYDLEIAADLETLLGLPGGNIYSLTEGTFSDGLSASSVGDRFGVNADAAGYQAIQVTELWYEQSFLAGRAAARAGKLDLTNGYNCQDCDVAFDMSAYANDETRQFLNGALVNNPTIPFPDPGIGASLFVHPLDGWYLAAGVGDAQADARQTGLNTAFHGEDHFFSIFETGLAGPLLPACALRGAYRLGLWYDPQPKARFVGGGTKRDDIGFYLSFDQQVYAEDDADQGAGLFLRYGYADGDVNEIDHFWSFGGQYRGLLPGREQDVLAIGFAHGRLSSDVRAGEDYEAAVEIYYNVALLGWLEVTPSVQYIRNPGGDASVDDAVVIGLRAQLAF